MTKVPSNKQRWWRHILGGAVTILGLVIFLRQVNLAEVLSALAQFDWIYLVWGVGSLAFGYALKIVRWSILLKAAGANATFLNCSAPFLGSIALNNLLPLRVGDVVRALVFPKSMGITKSTATSSLIVERLIDIMTLLLSLAIGLFAIQTIAIPSELKVTAITLASIGGVVLTLGFFFSRILGDYFSLIGAREDNASYLRKIYQALGSMLHGFNLMSRPRVLMALLFSSMLVWLGEAGLYYSVLLGAGIDGSLLVALLVMAIATLSTLLPSSPGYVGSFHLAAFTAVSLVGDTAARAGSYAVIVHLSLWLPTTLAGVIAIWISPSLFRTAKSQVA